MRKLVAVAIACLLTPLIASSVVASTSTTITTDITVGAGHALPSGAWGFSDGCQTGIASGEEYRCAFEFDISAIPSTATVTSAILGIRRSGGCATNDCPVTIYSYTGNGTADLGDVLGGLNLATWTPSTTTAHYLNVLGYIQNHATAGDDWAGFRLSSGGANTTVQDFDISSGARVSLAVTYVAQPVNVQVYLSGVGEGANGSVSSSPAGIDCGATCLAPFEYAEPVTLTAHPANTATFGYWQGGPCDQSHNAVCSFDVPALNVETTAVFYGIEPTAAPTAKPSATAPHATASPKPSTKASPGPSAAPPASPDTTAQASAEASAGSSPTDSAAASLAPGATPAPTTIPSEPTSGDGSSAPLIIGFVLLIAVLGGGFYFWSRRRQGGVAA